MTTKPADERIQTGVRNLDSILFGGIPKGSLVVVAGTPGAGKTILSQQIVFHHASPTRRVLFIQTLSEPTAKTLKYLNQFSFFDPKLLENGSIQFVDLGGIARTEGLEEATTLLMEHVKRVKPEFVVIDSFKVFEDLARSREGLRKFSYEMAIHLMAWETTAFLLGEFNQKDIETNPVFSIVDGLIRLTVRETAGEQQRLFQVVKMRGTDHSRDEHPFAISSQGLSIYAPRVTIRRDPQADRTGPSKGLARAMTGISGFDDLLGEGIPYGSSLLISGAAGTGKTLLSLELIYRGAKEYGEKGIFISFEETEERLRFEARSMGWDLDGEIDRGNIEIIFIPQTDILIEKHLLLIHERLSQMGAWRVAIDSISLFFHKARDVQIAREKVFQLATLVQMAKAVGFFVTDVPYGTERISSFGVEETVVDGVVLLTSSPTDRERERHIEVYKLRNTAHASGKRRMMIGPGGIHVQAHPITASGQNQRKPKRQKPKRK